MPPEKQKLTFAKASVAETQAPAARACVQGLTSASLAACYRIAESAFRRSELPVKPTVSKLT